ncbi:pseudouridine synthase [Aromatoleum evansii]|uniref:pseudouridine synthase n=1 Tax=Aromatoleum evansii TaxID=59406 RepID=UPI00145FC8C3|nr:pseudouridine synthase [Aromatoleum evansii]NMG30136.1 pseudouridine synthase [Aromatoleum evansii]
MKRSKDAGTPGDAPEQEDATAAPRRTLGVKKQDEAPTAETQRRVGVRARFQPGYAKAIAKSKPAAGDEKAQVRKAGRTQEGGRDAGEAPGRKPRPQAGAGAAAAPRPRRDGGKAPAKPGSERTERRQAASGAPAPRARRGERPIEARPAPRATASPAAAAEGVRLSKVMAERGLCSRREADEFIERGWVLVDGQCVSELGTRIDPNAEITLAPQASRRQSQRATILLHKPVGYVSGQPEPGYEPAVSLIGAANQFDRDTAQPFDFAHLKGLAPAGRLDIDSTGLLVLTQDGRIARQLIGDDSEVDKEYLVRVEGELDDRGLALLNHGLELDGRKLRRAKVEWINEDQLRFVLREGRKRQIRRMCELVGLKVVGLKRIRIGRVRLGDLPLGQWRFLHEDERF